MKIALLALAVNLLGACGGDGDPTFMGVCEIGGVFIYPAGSDTVSAACDTPTEIRWPSVPLRVSYGDLGDDFDDSADTALDFWNSEVDVRLFVRDEQPGAAVVTLGIGSVSGNTRGAASHARDDAGQLSASVELRGVADVTEAYYVLAHELGHVLGLAHDVEPFASIMYPQLDVGWTDEGFRRIRVTSSDQDALRAVYAP